MSNSRTGVQLEDGNGSNDERRSNVEDGNGPSSKGKLHEGDEEVADLERLDGMDVDAGLMAT